MDPDATWHQSAPTLFATAVDALLQRGDGALSPEDAARLEAIRQALQVHEALVEDSILRIEAACDTYHRRITESLRAARVEQNRRQFLRDLAAGTTPAVRVSNVVLTDGEHVYWKVPGILMEHRVVGRRSSGRMAGVSVRVARGVTVHSGGSGGFSEQVREWEPVSSGELIVTSFRLIFIGMPKSLDCRWDKMLEIRPYQDGLGFTTAARHKQWIVRLEPNHAEEIGAALQASTAHRDP
jgi:hypothetical protein